jgi:hypothetical protein
VLGEIAWAHAHVAWLREQVRELPPEDLTFGVERHTVKRPAGEDGTPGPAMAEVTRAARPHALVVLYGQERDRLVKMCEVAHRMGIEERQLELTERHGTMLATVLRAVIGDRELGLDADQQNVARQVAARHLRLVAGGAA